jgi:type IV pilus assembly protein PilA
MLKRLRERAGSESGFTLIELLVVMLILGILAAIAIPAFLNQKGKANDSSAKVQVRTMQTAMETCASDNTGSASYTGCDLSRLNSIEPTIPSPTGSNPPAQPAISANGTGYTVTSARVGDTQNYFQITKIASGQANAGTVTHDCGTTASSATPPVLTNDGAGGCTPGGNW